MFPCGEEHCDAKGEPRTHATLARAMSLWAMSCGLRGRGQLGRARKSPRPHGLLRVVGRTSCLFWRGEKDQDKADAYDTLYSGARDVTKVCAPLPPLLCDEIHRGLTGEDSVHLTDWTHAATLPADRALVAAMNRARDACSVALSLRES